MATGCDTNSAASILLVDDEEDTLKLLATILAKKYPHASLYTATNGRSGLNIFTTHMPAIVITDINMPQMDGIQLAGNIRALKPDTCFIAITGNSWKPEGNEFEFGQVVMKPVVFGKLFSAIEECLGALAPEP